MNEISPIDQALLRVTFVKYVAAAVKAAETEVKADLDAAMKRGDTLSVRSPIDSRKKMARVSKSDPKDKAVVTDPLALDEWVREHYADKLRTETSIIGTDGEIVAVLREHAPHLLATTTVIPAWAINELLTMAEAAGQPIGYSGEIDELAPPGIEIQTPNAVVSVTLDKATGPAALRELWDAHMFGLDGTVIALPSGEQAA